MLNSDLMSKDKFSLHKAFLLKEGERLQLNVSDDTFGVNKNSAIAEFIKNYIRELQSENPEATDDDILNKLEELKGKTFKMVEVKLRKEVYSNVKYKDYFDQDRNVVRTSLNMYPHAGMNVNEVILDDFEITSNGAGGFNVNKVKLH